MDRQYLTIQSGGAAFRQIDYDLSPVREEALKRMQRRDISSHACHWIHHGQGQRERTMKTGADEHHTGVNNRRESSASTIYMQDGCVGLFREVKT